jgi:CDP-diacylglycerol--glycerol-3-phosphate 3-phosphatidyltransferase
MRLAKQTFVLFSGIAASFSTASSFGTSRSPSVLSLKNSKGMTTNDRFVFGNIRGGSDAPAPELAAAQTQSEPEPEPEPEPAVAVDPTPVAPAAVATTQKGMGPNSRSPGFLRKLFPNFPWYTLPNQLTYARCVAIPGLILQFYLSQHPNKNIHSSLLFAIASITDYLDGYLARRWDICSPFGAFLDPVADKLMVSTALILLAGKYGAVVAVPTAIILAREIAVSALREWMASRGARDSVKVGFQGKCKTALTMASLTVILAVPDGAWDLGMLMKKAAGWDAAMNVGMVMLFMSAFVTITSGSVYFKAAAPVLMESK